MLGLLPAEEKLKVKRNWSAKPSEISNRATTTINWREILIILLTFVNMLRKMLNFGLEFVS